MKNLFKYEGYKLTIEPEALLLKPIKVLWNRDKSKHKEIALAEIGFVYFFCDPRSDYQYIVDEEERAKAIIEGEGLPKKWKPDKLVLECMNFYSSFKTSSTLLLEDTRIAIDKLRTLLRTIDLNQVDDKGKPMYTLNTVTATIKQIPSLVSELEKAERAIKQEYLSESKMRGQGEKTISEDGLSGLFD